MTLEINDEFNEEEFDKNQTAGLFIQADNLLRQFRDLFANSPWARFNPAAHELDRKRLLPEHADWPGLCQHIVSLMNQPDSREKSDRDPSFFHLRLAGIHWYQSEHVFCHPKDLPTAEQLARLSSSELSAWRKPHAYKFRRFREQAKKHGWNIPNGPKGTRMICEELLRRKNAVEEGLRQIAAMRQTLERDCQMELNVSGSIGYDLFTDQFHRRSNTSLHLTRGIERANYFTPVIVGCDLGGAMDKYNLPSAKEMMERSEHLAENEPHPLLLRDNPLRQLIMMNFYGASTVFFAQKNGKPLPGQNFQWSVPMRRSPKRGEYHVTVDYHTLRQFLFPPRERSPEAVVSAMAAALEASDARSSRREGVRPDLELQFPPPPPALPAKQKDEHDWTPDIREINFPMPSFSLRRNRKDAAESRRPLFSEPPAPDAPVRARPRGNPAS